MGRLIMCIFLEGGKTDGVVSVLGTAKRNLSVSLDRIQQRDQKIIDHTVIVSDNSYTLSGQVMHDSLPEVSLETELSWNLIDGSVIQMYATDSNGRFEYEQLFGKPRDFEISISRR